jgi:hypothetical protein
MALSWCFDYIKSESLLSNYKWSPVSARVTAVSSLLINLVLSKVIATHDQTQNPLVTYEWSWHMQWQSPFI